MRAAATADNAQTLDDVRRVLAPAIADAAAFDGWTHEAVIAAAQGCGIDVDAALYAFDGGEFSGGAMAMIAAFIDYVDAEMVRALPADVLAALPVRERIGRLIRCRLDRLRGREEALRRALAIMAMPGNVPAALRLGWHSADAMWRLAGDMSADYNHYTKRATLAAIYSATLAVFVGDESEGKADTLAFLDRRIDGVMRFEKAKARITVSASGNHFSVVRLLGRLRYPAR